MIELDKGNVATCKKLFKMIHPDAKVNIYCGDTLSVTSDVLKKQFDGVDKFDVVMGNPPYQPSQLWEKFIKYALTILKDDGYLTFVVPTSWTSPTSDSWNMLKEKCILLVNNASYLKDEYFPKIGSTFSYFVVKNKDCDEITHIIYEKGKMFEFNIKDVTFLPKILTPMALSINEKLLINKLDNRFIRKDLGDKGGGFSVKKEGDYKHPFITFIKPTGDPDIKYLKIQDPRQSNKKVLLFRNGYINPYYDDGIYGVGDNIHALQVDSKHTGEQIVKLFKTDLYEYIFNVNKHSQYNHGGLMDLVFRDVDKLKTIDDDSVYKYFKISDEEQQFIKKFLGSNTKSKSNSKTNKRKRSNGAAKHKTKRNRRT